MAFSDIRTRVTKNVNRDDIPDTSGGLIDRWVNDAQRRICRAHNFSFMEAEADTILVVDQRNYALPTGSGSDLRFKAEISLEIISAGNDRLRLKRIFKQDAERKGEFVSTTKSDTPRKYAIQKGQIYLYPLPGTALSMNLEYYGYLDDLSADTDTNDLVDDYPDMVEYLATSSALRYALEEERADYWESKATALMKEMIAEDDSNKYGNIEEGMEPEDGAGTYPRTRLISDYLIGF